jgi:predicted metal-dependent HD superfamily phosphohydrolase
MESALDKGRFEDLWSRVATATDAADCEEAWRELVQSYSEPERFYHSDKHVAFCLSELDTLANGPVQRDLVELSIWFHDLVYEMGAKDNERRSAERFAELAKDQLEPAAIDTVYRLIMATVHDGEPGSLDAQYMVDLDIAGMGGSWERYLEDSEALRRERPDQNDVEFFAGKKVFLQALLDRPSIYLTQEFLERREKVARENITRYLADYVYPLI